MDDKAPIIVERATAKRFSSLPPIRNSAAVPFTSLFLVFRRATHPANAPVPRDAIKVTTNTAQSHPLNPTPNPLLAMACVSLTDLARWHKHEITGAPV
ncbi:hypothetical protein E2C01_022322 [Portunus trituberculatus]|uniref:Uncharacterized protein n=1 Tax=Portunus trituberculatus TaxID=210409 RepID=A0A5B7E6Z3_PORTR|nr:hypothetical protein [Portunus trituberculatus]